MRLVQTRPTLRAERPSARPRPFVFGPAPRPRVGPRPAFPLAEAVDFRPPTRPLRAGGPSPQLDGPKVAGAPTPQGPPFVGPLYCWPSAAAPAQPLPLLWSCNDVSITFRTFTTALVKPFNTLSMSNTAFIVCKRSKTATPKVEKKTPKKRQPKRWAKPMPNQFNTLQRVRVYLNEHRSQRRQKVYDHLEQEFGLRVEVKRHKQQGGVGSYYWLPMLRCYRVQVGASRITTKCRCFRYAPVVEIYDNLTNCSTF